MSISITVPMERRALTAAAKMFKSLADEMVQVVGVPAPEEHPLESKVLDTISKEWEVPLSLLTASDVSEETAVPSPEVFAAPEPDTAPEPDPISTDGLDVDSQGIPWDARIHASSKATLARPAGAWKKKRGVTDEEVAAVEAELKAAISVPEQEVHAASVTTPPPPAEGIPVMEVPPAPRFTDDQATKVTRPGDAPDVETFPQLIAAISSRGIDQEKVIKAVNSAGLQSLPLLAARPDLVPIVARVLGL